MLHSALRSNTQSASLASCPVGHSCRTPGYATKFDNSPYAASGRLFPSLNPLRRQMMAAAGSSKFKPQTVCHSLPLNIWTIPASLWSPNSLDSPEITNEPAHGILYSSHMLAAKPQISMRKRTRSLHEQI